MATLASSAPVPCPKIKCSRFTSTTTSSRSRFFNPRGQLLATELAATEEFDGYSCIFCTRAMPQDKMLSLYFDKDVVEKAFRSLKGITQLRPVRHWLTERVHAHVFLCYLAY